ncbi:hypothetical protein M885DRAFT_603359, partial [Pelagophyceae sp. CCMP2097]
CAVSSADHAATSASIAVLEYAADERQKLITSGDTAGVLCPTLKELGPERGLSVNCANHAVQLGYDRGTTADKAVMRKPLQEENGGEELNAAQLQCADLNFGAREVELILHKGTARHYLNLGRTAYTAWQLTELYKSRFKGCAAVALLSGMGERFIWAYASWSKIAPQIAAFTFFLMLSQTNMLQTNAIQPLRSVVIVFGGFGRAAWYCQICHVMMYIFKSAAVCGSRWGLLACIMPELMTLLDSVAKGGSLLASCDN